MFKKGIIVFVFKVGVFLPHISKFSKAVRTLVLQRETTVVEGVNEIRNIDSF